MPPAKPSSPTSKRSAIPMVVSSLTQLGITIGQINLWGVSWYVVKATAGRPDFGIMAMVIGGIVLLAVVGVYGLRSFQGFEALIRAWRAGEPPPTLEVQRPPELQARVRERTRTVEIESDFPIVEAPVEREALPVPPNLEAPTMPRADQWPGVPDPDPVDTRWEGRGDWGP